MNKMILIGLLVALGLSFAQGPPMIQPAWSALVQASCQGAIASYQAYDVSDYPYYYYDGGCYETKMPYGYQTLCEEVCEFEDGISWYYYVAAMTCGEEGQTSPACINALVQFYSRAAAARSMFSATKTAYFSAARNSIFAYNDCDTPGPGGISQNLAGLAGEYRSCIQDPMNYLSMFCSRCIAP